MDQQGPDRDLHDEYQRAQWAFDLCALENAR